MKVFLRIALVASIILYIIAPLPYDRDFCSICLFFFVVAAGYIIIDDTKRLGYLNFNTMFLFSFFVCSYVYPVFLVGKNSITGRLIEHDLNTLATVNRCVALCTIAICAYSNAYLFYRRNTKLNVTNNELNEASNISIYLRKPMVIVCILMIIALVQFMNTTHDVSIEVNDYPYLFQTFYFMLPLFLVCASIYYHKKSRGKALKYIICHNISVLILLLILILLFIYIGDRAPLMTIALTFVATIALFVKRIKPLTFFCVGFIGIILMFALRVTRGGESSISEGGLDVFFQATQSSIIDNVSPWDLLADLVCINMELNAGMNYVDRFGFLFPGANALVTISAPVPFLPSLLTSIFYGKLPIEVNSGAAIGNFTNSTAGNHCVIDMFMPFGVWGVVIAFLIFGWGMARITNGLKDSVFCKVFYVYMMSSAIFLSRNSLTNIYRAVVLSFIIYCVIMYFIKKNIKKLN